MDSNAQRGNYVQCNKCGKLFHRVYREEYLCECGLSKIASILANDLPHYSEVGDRKVVIDFEAGIAKLVEPDDERYIFDETKSTRCDPFDTAKWLGLR
jgi:hypothetical protein